MPVFSRRLGDFKINEGTLLKWARKAIGTHKRIAYTLIPPDKPLQGQALSFVEVSTVFLGINHSYSYRTPVLFETMIFGGEHDRAQWRYTNIKAARRGHREAVTLVETALANYNPDTDLLR